VTLEKEIRDRISSKFNKGVEGKSDLEEIVDRVIA